MKKMKLFCLVCRICKHTQDVYAAGFSRDERAAFVCSRCDRKTDYDGKTCAHCGEPSTHTRYGQGVCYECDPEEPRGDHPLGGMGYGIDYGEAQREARKLK